MKQGRGNKGISNNVVKRKPLVSWRTQIWITIGVFWTLICLCVGSYADITTGISYTFPVSFRVQEDVTAINIQKNFDFISDQLKTINANFAKLDSTRNR